MLALFLFPFAAGLSVTTCSHPAGATSGPATGSSSSTATLPASQDVRVRVSPEAPPPPPAAPRPWLAPSWVSCFSHLHLRDIPSPSVPFYSSVPLHPEGGSFRRCVTGGHTACRQRSALTPCTLSPTSPSRPCPQSQSCSSQPPEPQTRGHRRARPAPPLASFSPPSGTSHRTCLILLQLFLKRDQAP